MSEKFSSDFELADLVEDNIEEPKYYKVLLHNDDYTTMDFVVEVLQKIFHKDKAEAYAIMMKVHTEGIGVCGIYPLEIAETKVFLVKQMARSRGFPLKCTLEEV
ncbi:ATP-dependent Clp protease adapter ClpS [Desulfonauticus submarinus]|uniref:ATP-dependent Clp protease adapter protein ClpS n=1 Tax=Desulfonauticus submarinus TaxID=206665 RepID=A0A1H0FQI5_9BACT|nr:ATP-dependent Clp protease adapter ClpS [Desulfonauticus submarinus]SDN96792.1 ATP-dependent Clp protease adaptor protein ClpS [Desulfonauticus submarinus]